MKSISWVISDSEQVFQLVKVSKFCQTIKFCVTSASNWRTLYRVSTFNFEFHSPDLRKRLDYHIFYGLLVACHRTQPDSLFHSHNSRMQKCFSLSHLSSNHSLDAELKTSQTSISPPPPIRWNNYVQTSSRGHHLITYVEMVTYDYLHICDASWLDKTKPFYVHSSLVRLTSCTCLPLPSGSLLLFLDNSRSFPMTRFISPVHDGQPCLVMNTVSVTCLFLSRSTSNFSL